MGFEGLITGSAKRRKRRYRLTVRLFDSDGKLLLKKAYSIKRSRFPAGTADRLAALILNKLASAPAGEFPVADNKVEPPQEGLQDHWKFGADSSAPTAEPPRKDRKPPWVLDAASSPPTAEKKKAAPPAAPKTDVGAVPDIMLSAGMSLNLRKGLEPKHEMKRPIPGIRLDARFFLGSFSDAPVFEDIGIAATYNLCLASSYGIENQEEKYDSSQSSWKAEALYRLTFDDAPLSPAFLVRLGYGSSSCTIQTDEPDLLSASYNYPYGALDIYIMLARPIVRFFVSGGYLLVVSTGEDLSGKGMGFNLMTGIEFKLFGALLVGAGYDMFKLFINDENLGDTSDSYTGFFLRVGWGHR